MRKRDSEFTLPPASDFPAWLAGILEIAGTVAFSSGQTSSKGRSYIYSYPVVKMGDNDPGRINRLQSLAGGKQRRLKDMTTREWFVKGVPAVDLAGLIEPFAPTRQNAIAAFRLWEQTDSNQDRLGIAEELKASPSRFSAIDETDYRNLVKNPEFLSGVIDARGVIQHPEHTDPNYPDYGWVYQMIAVASMNLSLLGALKEEFGGNIEYRIKSYATPFPETATSAVWKLSHVGLGELIRITANNLKLRKFE